MPQQLPVTLRAGITTLNLRLNVTAATQQVTVSEDAGPAVSTEAASNASATVLHNDDLDALSDDTEDLQADLEALAGPGAGPSGSGIFIDGFSGGQLPPKQSIREIRVNSNPFSPEYDHLGFGRIEIFTKPGTDKFHGSAAYNFATDRWNSRNPYSAQKAPLLLNEFEGGMSGRLTAKSSFTLDLSRNLVDNGSITNAVILDPVTLASVPLASFVTTPQHRYALNPHVDYQLSTNNTLSLRWQFTHSDVQDFGIGGFDLASRGSHVTRDFQSVQAADTYVHGSLVNETRFRFTSHVATSTANLNKEVLQVSGSFTDGGASTSRSSDTASSSELQNYTSLVHGTHFWRMGVRLRGQSEDQDSPANFNGTFTFSGGLAPQLDSANRPVPDPITGQPVVTRISSLEQYRRTLLFKNLPAAQIRALGGGASQYSIASGQSAFSVNQYDIGLFIGDDWKLRPNLTVNLGFRYEAQTNIGDHSDFAPRLAFAWAPGSTAKKQGKTVIRGGSGFFYDRFGMGYTLNALRFAGGAQKRYVVSNPDTYPVAPAPDTFKANTLTLQEVDSNLRAPWILQSAFTLERQLPASTTFAATYTNTHVVHNFRSLAINAPRPDKTLPFPGQGPIFLMTSSGIYNQNQLNLNVNTKVSSAVSMFGNYTLNRALSDSEGIGSYPANPYNYAGEYGPSNNDIRHRGQFGGTLTMRWNIRLNPLFTLQSGAPFNITAGQDTYGTTLYNARPAIATDPAKGGVINTAYGLLDPNPLPGMKLLPRNFGRGPDIISFNIRAGRTWRFGTAPEGSAPAKHAATMGGIFAAPSAGGRYNLTASMSVRNLLNRNNPGPIIGSIASPLFGQANQLFGTVNGEGFSENANNRRLELQLKLGW